MTSHEENEKVKEYLPLAYWWVSKYKHWCYGNISIEDLKSIALMSIAEGLRRFKPVEKGNSLSTFISLIIKYNFKELLESATRDKRLCPTKLKSLDDSSKSLKLPYDKRPKVLDVLINKDLIEKLKRNLAPKHWQVLEDFYLKGKSPHQLAKEYKRSSHNHDPKIGITDSAFRHRRTIALEKARLILEEATHVASEPTRMCYGCNISKNESDFGRYKRSEDGLQIKCKDCVRKYDRAAYYKKRYKKENGSKESKEVSAINTN